MTTEFSKPIVRDIGLNIGKVMSNNLLVDKGFRGDNGLEQDSVAQLFHGNFKAHKKNRYHHQLNDLVHTKFTMDKQAVTAAHTIYETFFKWVVTTCAAGEIDHQDLAQLLRHFKRVSRKLKTMAQTYLQQGDQESAEAILDKLAHLNAFIQQLKRGLSLADVDKLQEDEKAEQGTQIWLIELICAMALIHLFLFGLATELMVLTFGLAGVLIVSLLLKMASIAGLSQHKLRIKKELWEQHQFLKRQAELYGNAIQTFQIKAKTQQHADFKRQLQGQRPTGKRLVMPLLR